MTIKGITKAGKVKLESVLSDISAFTCITENDEGTYDIFFRAETNVHLNYSMGQDMVAIGINAGIVLYLSTSDFYELCIY